MVGAEAEVTLRLDGPRSLFEAPAPDYFSETATLVPGVEQLVTQLRTRRLDGGVRTTIELPPRDVEPGLEDRITAAVGRYCRIRIEELDDHLRALRREALGGLAIGLVLLAAGLALSQLTTHSGLPPTIRVFFGDGVFLVAAWVGLWYPLDLLIYTPRPYRRDRQVLEAIAEMETVVRAAG